MKVNCFYWVLAFVTFFSCSNDNEINYRMANCRVEMKGGACFTLCAHFGIPIEDMMFENDTVMSGRAFYFMNEDAYRFEIAIGRKFTEENIDFETLYFVFKNDSITWKNTSIPNFLGLIYGDVTYYEVNDSVFHFKLYGDEKVGTLPIVDSHSYDLRVKAEMKIHLPTLLK